MIAVLVLSFVFIVGSIAAVANAAMPLPDRLSFTKPLGPSSSGAIRISQVYGGGGNSGSVYKRDFIEIFNIGTTSVSFNSWSVQYASAAGTSWSKTLITGTLSPGQYFLVAEDQGAGGTTDLPTPDMTGTIIMATAAGKVALVNTSTTLSGSCPTTNTGVIDFVGYGATANCYEGITTTLASGNNTSAIRKLNGCQDTDDNNADFSLSTPPNPRNTSTSINICGLSISKSAVASVNYNSIFTYTLIITNATITATDVVITDLIPSNATYVPNSASSAGELIDGTTISWTIASMTHAAIVSRTFVVTAPVVGGSIVNDRYRVSASNITSDAVGSAITTSVLAPAIGLIKTASPNSNVAYHGLVTYTLVVSNNGTAAATNTFVTDTLPGEVDFASWIISPTNTIEASDVITWNGTLSIGQAITFTFVVTHVGSYAEVVTNTVQFDQISGAGSASAAFNVESGASSLSMRKSVTPSIAAYHDVVTYSIVVSNVGSAAALNTLVTDTLPSEVDFAHWLDQPIGADAGSDQITWAGTISVGQAITFTFVVTHVGLYGEVITNTALFDQADGSGSSSAAFEIATPRVQLNKGASPNSNVSLHSEVTYTLVISNNGSAAALNTFITDTLPSEVNFDHWIDQAGANESANVITWTGTLAIGQSITFTFVVSHVGAYGDVVTNTAQFAQAADSGSSSAVFNVISATPNLALTKLASPQNKVSYHGAVTYTLLITNSGALNADNTFITDTLPADVTFARWIDSADAAENANVITWNGTVTSGQSIALTFVVTHTGSYNESITNTAQFEHSSGSGSASASFSIEPLYPIVFVYHDGEDVVQTGEPVSISIDFNGVTPLSADAGYSIFSGTINLPAGVHAYRYVALGQPDWLNTLTRSITVTSAATIDDYRNVSVDAAKLQAPSVTTTTINVATENILGRVHVLNVTEPTGAARGLKAQLGYGVDSSPGNWTWSTMNFDLQVANDDQFASTIIPTATGLYSVAVRFDPNWGVGNPNALWTYGDLNDLPFSIDQAGVLHVFNGPSLSIGKQVMPTLRVARGGLVTYTIVLTNSGDLIANNVSFTDSLPTQADFGAWIISPTNTIEASDIITWSGDIQSGQTITFAFTSIVSGAYGSSVTNTGSIAYQSAITSSSASFTFDAAPIIINEIDSDNVGPDNAEFIELYDGGVGHTSLNGLVVVLFGGTGSKVYAPTFDLDGYSTNANGYFLIGGNDISLTADLSVTSSSWLQNVPSAVALFVGSASDFPANKTITNTDLSQELDAIVYRNSSATAPGLQVLLNANEPQPNENGRSSGTLQSLQRCANGSGGARNTSTVYPSVPTPGAVNACPSLSIGQSVTPTNNVAYHGNVTYTLVLSNSGAGDALTTQLTDTLPAEVDFAHPIDLAGANVASDVITWTGQVTASQAITFTFVVTHAGTYNDVVTNTAQFSHNTGSGVAAATFTVVPASPQVSLIKRVSPSSNVNYHGNVTYTIVISNDGNADALNTFVTDTLPNEVDFASWIISPTNTIEASDVITWNGTLSIGQSITFTFVVTHNGNYGDVITNTAQFDQASGSGSSDATFTVLTATPNLQMSKSVWPFSNVAYHGEVTYTVLITNSGALDAVSTFITDALPSGLTFARWITSSGANQSANVITWTGTVSSAQSIALRFVVTHTGSYGEMITNTAQFDHSSGTGSSSATFSVVPAAPHLIFSKSVTPNSNVTNQSVVTYTLVLTNDGSALANSVLFTDTLPNALTFNSWIVSPTNTSLNGQKIAWSGNVLTNSVLSWNFTAIVSGTGLTVNNIAQINYQSIVTAANAALTVQPSVNVLINELDAQTTGTDAQEFIELYDGGLGHTPLDGLVLVLFSGSTGKVYPPTFDLDGYSTDVNGYLVIGNSAIASAVITFANNKLQNGPEAAAVFLGNASDFPTSLTITSTNLSQEIDAVVYVDIPSNGDSALLRSYLLNSNQPIVYEGSNAAQADARSVQRCPNGSGGYRNTLAYQASVPTPGVANACPSLSISKSVNPNSNVANHNTLTYTLLLNNNGAGDAFNTQLTDTLPSEVNFARWVTRSGANAASNVITWTGQVTANQSITFTFVVTHVGTYADVVTNTAQFAHNTGAGSSAATFSVIPPTPNLHINKSVSPANNVAYHGNVTYTLVLSNNGTGDASMVMLTDTLPIETDFARWLNQPIGAAAASDRLTWAGAISIGQSITFTFVVTHVGSYGEVVTNTAQFEHSSGSGSSSATFSVMPAFPVLSIGKSVSTAHVPVKLGDPITYTLVVTNSGPGNAIGVVMTDVLPSGVSGSNLNQTINISASQRVSFTIAAVVTNNVAYYGKSITNTVVFSYSSGSGSASVAFTIEPIPPANVSAIKFSLPNNQRVLPNSLVTYTIVLSNSGGVNAAVRITDVIGSYFTVFNALNFTQSPTGTLKWSGVVTAGQSITLNFVVKVKVVSQLSVGHTLLNNAATIDDGAHVPYVINSINASWVDVFGIYLPIVKKNS
jgi:uncharacterized repeat protein (TIGR01451 family)